MGAFYLFDMEGIYQYDGEVPQSLYDLGVRAGDVKWKDIDDNGIINDDDRVVMGSSNPDFYGGWNNSFDYKGWQLAVNTTFKYGNDVYAAWKAHGAARTGGRFAQELSYQVNRWTGPGTTNVYPRAIDGLAHNNKNSDRFLEDGSFFKIRTIALSYTFNKSVIGSLGMKSLRLYGKIDNPFLFTNYSGWDPEVNTNLDPRYAGIDNYSVPTPLTISFGANISF